jgi:hypothetical protein
MTRAWAILLGFTLLASSAAPQKKLAEDKSKFLQETDPVKRAKRLAKLSRDEFKAVDKSARAGDLAAALEQLAEYRNEVLDTQKRLNSTGVRASRKPAGFRQLEIALREFVRRLDDLTAEMDVGQRAPFLKIRRQLNAADQRLLNQIFPSRVEFGKKKQEKKK